MLRPYQLAAFRAAIEWIRVTAEPAVIEAATGAGKSHIIAALAEVIHKKSGKSVLCLAPSAELVTQNREKFLHTGMPASVLSASAGGKCTKHPVIFGTPVTVKNALRRLLGKVSMVVIDEAHGITPTVKSIIAELKAESPRMRVIGLTATPYRLGDGYIYEFDQKDVMVHETQTRDPYFKKLIYRITAHDLIAQGFLTPPNVGESLHQYDTSGLVMERGQFTSESVDKAFVGKGRLTSDIVFDIVEQSRFRMGVIIFASTVKHAKEIMESLPVELSDIVTGETPKKDRREIISRFKARRIKYLVNVSVLTTGFDAPHVDVIALMRRTESAGLLQQMLGRGARLHDNKRDFLVLDYAGNIDAHFPDGDVFDPDIKASRKGGSTTVEVKCPQCQNTNQFSARPNDEGYGENEYGYFVDADGNEICADTGSVPSHFGRRCTALVMPSGFGSPMQCSYRWTFKSCPHCEHENDIAARYCEKCKGEIIDPNQKLRIDFAKRKADPTMVQTDRVLEFSPVATLSQAGKKMIRIEVITEYRRFTLFISIESSAHQAAHARHVIKKQWAEGDGGMVIRMKKAPPKTITYRKEESGFYRLIDFDRPADEVQQ